MSTSNTHAKEANGATSLSVYTDVLSNPDWQAPQPPRRLHSNVSFTYLIPFNIVTLSTRDAVPGAPLGGLLYVPDLPTDDPCTAVSAPYVPTNVTRAHNLPPASYGKWIGFAPWVSVNCSLKYLSAASSDAARSILFYLPNDNNTAPPSADSAIWGLSPGYSESAGSWKQSNDFPVYAIPGVSGYKLMRASSQYSGNMTSVPYGHVLTEYYDSRDYVRLYINITTADTDNLPSLWIFLLVVLGIMLAIIGLTSLIMHWLQMRRRNSLRRRVVSGEVDLEALGIKRLTVPQEILDEMPLYTYGSGETVQLPPTATNATSNASPLGEKEESSSSTRPVTPAPTSPPAPAMRRAKPHRPTSLQQPTCAICLDDFVPASGGTQGTIVREMPCQHIFHPECVDTFLRDSSSLCPMCKKTALPTGYCPRVITNAMVRRERTVRRLRPRAEPVGRGDRVGENADHVSALRRSRAVGANALSRFSSWNSRIEQQMSSAPMTSLNQPHATEMTTSVASVTPSHGRSSATPVAAPPPAAAQQSAPVRPSSNPGRREWARQRAVAMLGRHTAPVDPDAEEQHAMPRWRKALLGIFPAAER